MIKHIVSGDVNRRERYMVYSFLIEFSATVIRHVLFNPSKNIVSIAV